MTRKGFMQAKYIMLALVALLFTGVFAYVIQVYILPSKAGQVQVHLTHKPETLTIEQGQKQETILLIQPEGDYKLSGFDITYTMRSPDGVGVQLFAIGSPKAFPDDGSVSFTELINKDGRASYVVIAEDIKLPGVIQVPLTIACQEAGKGIISINLAKTKIIGTVQGDLFTPGTVGDLNVVCVSGGSGGGGQKTFDKPYIQYSASPVIASMEQGGTAMQEVVLTPRNPVPGSTSNLRISGFELKFSFDPSVAMITKISPPITDEKTTFTALVENIDNSAGQVQVSYVLIASDDKLPQSVRIPLTYQGVAPSGNGDLKLTFAEVTGNIDGYVYENDAVYPETVGKYTIGSSVPGKEEPAPDGDVELKISARLQGILKKPNNHEPMPVKVGVFSERMDTPLFKDVSMVFNEDGTITGIASFDIEPGDRYALYLKPSHGIQRKICTKTPIETYPGTYSCTGYRGEITLVKGQNSIDATGIYLVVGDLPEQDGIVNSYDVTLVRSLLGKTDAESVRLADLNRDGRVSSDDYARVQEALSTRVDDR